MILTFLRTRASERRERESQLGEGEIWIVISLFGNWKPANSHASFEERYIMQRNEPSENCIQSIGDPPSSVQSNVADASFLSFIKILTRQILWSIEIGDEAKTKIGGERDMSFFRKLETSKFTRVTLQKVHCPYLAINWTIIAWLQWRRFFSNTTRTSSMNPHRSIYFCRQIIFRIQIHDKTHDDWIYRSSEEILVIRKTNYRFRIVKLKYVCYVLNTPSTNSKFRRSKK